MHFLKVYVYHIYKGYYRDDIPLVGPFLSRLYWRLMGAHIGERVRIHRKAKLCAADLLVIEDDVCIDQAIVRPFAVEEVGFSQFN